MNLGSSTIGDSSTKAIFFGAALLVAVWGLLVGFSALLVLLLALGTYGFGSGLTTGRTST